MSLPNDVVSYRVYRYQWNVGATATGVVAGPGNTSIPSAMTLNENYPNPFNPTTKISFVLPTTGTTSLKVYNILARRSLLLLTAWCGGKKCRLFRSTVPPLQAASIFTVSKAARKSKQGKWFC